MRKLITAAMLLCTLTSLAQAGNNTGELSPVVFDTYQEYEIIGYNRLEWKPTGDLWEGDTEWSACTGTLFVYGNIMRFQYNEEEVNVRVMPVVMCHEVFDEGTDSQTDKLMYAGNRFDIRPSKLDKQYMVSIMVYDDYDDEIYLLSGDRTHGIVFQILRKDKDSFSYKKDLSKRVRRKLKRSRYMR